MYSKTWNRSVYTFISTDAPLHSRNPVGGVSVAHAKTVPTGRTEPPVGVFHSPCPFRNRDLLSGNCGARPFFVVVTTELSATSTHESTSP